MRKQRSERNSNTRTQHLQAAVRFYLSLCLDLRSSSFLSVSVCPPRRVPGSVTQDQFFIVVVSVSLDRERLFRSETRDERSSTCAQRHAQAERTAEKLSSSDSRVNWNTRQLLRNQMDRVHKVRGDLQTSLPRSSEQLIPAVNWVPPRGDLEQNMFLPRDSQSVLEEALQKHPRNYLTRWIPWHHLSFSRREATGR